MRPSLGGPLLGVIAGHCSVLWWREGKVTANFEGVDVVPLLGAIAACYCSVLWRNLGEWKWCHCRVPMAPYTAMASRKNILQTSLFSTLISQKLVFAIWGLCWYNFAFFVTFQIFRLTGTNNTVWCRHRQYHAVDAIGPSQGVRRLNHRRP